MKEVATRECKFIFHKPGNLDSLDEKDHKDIHIAKEKVQYKDGTYEDKLVIHENYQRPYWLTAEPFRRYKQKRETESLDRVRNYYTTETKLYREIAMRLKIPYRNRSDDRRVSSNPYVYGTDVSSLVFLRKDYEDEYPNSFTKYTYAALDIETNIYTDEITMISIARPGEVYTVMTEDYLKGISNPIHKLHKLFKEHIPLEESEVITPEFEICQTPLDLLKKVMAKAHKWSPDFLAVWNLDFEISNFIRLCEDNQVDIKDILSDPELPNEYKFFRYKKSPEVKMSASGVRKNTDPQDRWNIVYCPAKFYWIDAMCTYNFVRVNTKKVPTGYSLDSILGHELGSKFKKLKFPHLNTDQLHGIDYHKQMQKYHRLEYVIYNQWDVLSMIKLEQKTNDLSTSLPVLCSINPFDIFDSGPKKIVNKLLFTGLEEGLVLGCKSRMETEEDEILKENLGLDGWIVALPNKYLSADEGSKPLLENPDLPTNIRQHVADADQESGYPNGGRQANVSKDTTLRELLSVEGIDKEDFKRENINLMFGVVSHLQYCERVLNFPDIEQVDAFIKSKLDN